MSKEIELNREVIELEQKLASARFALDKEKKRVRTPGELLAQAHVLDMIDCISVFGHQMTSKHFPSANSSTASNIRSSFRTVIDDAIARATSKCAAEAVNKALTSVLDIPIDYAIARRGEKSFAGLKRVKGADVYKIPLELVGLRSNDLVDCVEKITRYSKGITPVGEEVSW